MSDPRLSSPSSIRLVAAAAAAVASLGVVALGVQLGTSGLVGDGPGRNPGSTSATPASATIDLPRSRPGATLEQELIALVPAVGTGAFGSSSAAGAFPPAPAPAAPAPTPPGPADQAPAPTPPSTPVPIPAPESPVPTPETPIPAPEPTIPPALDPIVEPIDDALSGLVAPSTEDGTSPTEPTPPSTTEPTLQDLVVLLLGS